VAKDLLIAMISGQKQVGASMISLKKLLGRSG